MDSRASEYLDTCNKVDASAQQLGDVAAQLAGIDTMLVDDFPVRKADLLAFERLGIVK